MSCEVERWLARLYTDAALRSRFLAAPEDVLAGSNLSPAERASLCAIDRVGLLMHAQSITSKRMTPARASRPRWDDYLRAFWERWRAR
jgi:hypothetical protein